MKKKLQIAAFYFLTIILTGCVPSLHPLFTEDEKVFDANLAGIWSTDSNEIWEFRKDAKGYECIYIDKDGKSGKFTGTLGKIQDNAFMDIYPKELYLNENDFYKFHFVPAHTFLKVHLAKDSLELRMLHPESLDKLLKSEPNAIKYERIENVGNVLTASTEELKKFIRKYGLDEKYELFGEAAEAEKMRRIQVEEPNQPKTQN
ncbi:MAG: hypothetical protein BWY69_01492 [Planctomycetes bacterium ADurb.Bin401]|nr:MAG: hypothetical protein BWY69_01492 [Planctomycetes bacterium ADurb.Bin401]